ncbi:1-acyl-sn-glycerol-3-phosphate acyltransferase [Microbacterium sp. P01]|uniref:1-acyl-sn-glycerol-3-phosphate acyltransferase n=1 Tax=unclassified Microbacterium TaxID=2609290 RepID=UPI00366DD0E0
MTRLPPVWVRRVLLAPLVAVGGPLLIGFTPLILIAFVIIASAIPRRFRWPRAVLMLLVYVLWDALLLIVLFALWIGSGFGWKVRSPAFVRAHYAVAAFALRALFWVSRGVLKVRIATEAAEETGAGTAPASFERMFRPGQPLVVASRHAGPGDSFILMHALLNHVKRMPRVVVKDTMQWDPAIDVLLNRLPTRFITPTGFAAPPGAAPRTGSAHPATEMISDLAKGLGPADAFVIFPEGGNYTEARRTSRIDRLRQGGNEPLAARAEALQHVLAPQPGGLYAALDSAPDADVVFIAHSGLDELATAGDLWRALPTEKRIVLHAWRVPRAEVPTDREDQVIWLFEWFARIDAWVGGRSSLP